VSCACQSNAESVAQLRHVRAVPGRRPLPGESCPRHVRRAPTPWVETPLSKLWSPLRENVEIEVAYSGTARARRSGVRGSSWRGCGTQAASLDRRFSSGEPRQHEHRSDGGICLSASLASLASYSSAVDACRSVVLHRDGRGLTREPEKARMSRKESRIGLVGTGIRLLGCRRQDVKIAKIGVLSGTYPQSTEALHHAFQRVP
jgi:hypothetical protein